MKWRGLEYEEATWEMEGDLEDWMHLVEEFKDREEHGNKRTHRMKMFCFFFKSESVLFVLAPCWRQGSMNQWASGSSTVNTQNFVVTTLPLLLV